MKFKVSIIFLHFIAISAIGQSNLVPFASVSPQQGFANPQILDFEVLNGNLYVIGKFDSIDGIWARNIAMYDGITWSSLPIIMDDPIALEAFNGELYILGHTGQIPAEPLKDEWISKWDGSQWLSLGDSAILVEGRNDLGPKDLEAFDGKLYVAGSFSGYSGFPNKRNLAAYDGSNWVMSDDGTLTSFTIWTLESHQNYLAIGGDISSANGSPANGVVTWDGSSYTPYSHPTATIVLDAIIPGADYIYADGYLYKNSSWQMSRLKGIHDGHAFYSDKLITAGYGLVNVFDTINLSGGSIDTLPWFNNSFSRVSVFGSNLIFGARAGIHASTIYVLLLSSVVGLSEKLDQDFIKLYPNPSEGVFTIRAERKELMGYKLIDSKGTKILEKEWVKPKDVIFLDLKPDPGIYTIEIDLQNGKVIKRVSIY